MHGAPALVLGAGGSVHVEIVGQRTGPQRRADVHVPGQRGGAAIAADLGGGQRVGLVVGAEAAMLFGNGDAEQAGAMQIPVILGREFRVAIVGRRAACEHGLAELARGRDDPGLFVVQPERVGIEDRRIQSDLVDRRHALAGLHRHHAVTCCCSHIGFQELIQRGVEGAGALEIDEMADAFEFNIFGGWNIARHLRHHRRRRIVVL